MTAKSLEISDLDHFLSVTSVRYNPTNIDVAYPQFFSGVVWLPSVEVCSPESLTQFDHQSLCQLRPMLRFSLVSLQSRTTLLHPWNIWELELICSYFFYGTTKQCYEVTATGEFDGVNQMVGN